MGLTPSHIEVDERQVPVAFRDGYVLKVEFAGWCKTPMWLHCDVNRSMWSKTLLKRIDDDITTMLSLNPLGFHVFVEDGNTKLVKFIKLFGAVPLGPITTRNGVPGTHWYVGSERTRDWRKQ